MKRKGGRKKAEGKEWVVGFPQKRGEKKDLYKVPNLLSTNVILARRKAKLEKLYASLDNYIFHG
uniref:Uncharacterized protein n=1 Tax=Onchocerca volvulus TaxID=6282 RepID=A0A8R1TKY2_ONCVO